MFKKCLGQTIMVGNRKSRERLMYMAYKTKMTGKYRIFIMLCQGWKSRWVEICKNSLLRVLPRVISNRKMITKRCRLSWKLGRSLRLLGTIKITWTYRSRMQINSWTTICWVFQANDYMSYINSFYLIFLLTHSCTHKYFNSFYTLAFHIY